MDLMSERSSAMNTEELIKKRKNERFAYILGIIANLLWALNGVQIKTFRIYFPDTYTDNSILFWRMFPVTVMGYIICKYYNIHIQTFSELKHLKWFLCRNALAYLFIIAWIYFVICFVDSIMTG